jgi:hypothetical protein
VNGKKERGIENEKRTQYESNGTSSGTGKRFDNLWIFRANQT